MMADHHEDRVSGSGEGWVAGTAWWLLRWHPWVAALLTAVVLVAVSVGPTALIWSVATATVSMVVWHRRHEASFAAVVGLRARAGWRREVVYSRQWRRVMSTSGLDCHRGDCQDHLPRLGRVRCRHGVDEVMVRLAPGQHLEDWERCRGTLAASFRAADCHVRLVGPDRLVLEVSLDDPGDESDRDDVDRVGRRRMADDDEAEGASHG
jgi:S-DNA-T family DNA segregation ATPase FtsK/SpoIIIE